jgi:hypothetical protein
MTKSSVSKFKVGDLVFITYLTEEEGGAIPRLITKINTPNGTTSTGKKRSSSE